MAICYGFPIKYILNRGIGGWKSFLKAAETLRATTLSLESILNPLGMQVGPGGSVVIIRTLL